MSWRGDRVGAEAGAEGEEGVRGVRRRRDRFAQGVRRMRSDTALGRYAIKVLETAILIDATPIDLPASRWKATDQVIRCPFATAALYFDLATVEHPQAVACCLVGELGLFGDDDDAEFKLAMVEYEGAGALFLASFCVDGPIAAGSIPYGDDGRPMKYKGVDGGGIRDPLLVANFQSLQLGRDAKEDREHYEAVLSATAFVLNLLSAKNVAVREIPVRRVKKRRRSRPEFTWHELTVCQSAAPSKCIAAHARGRRITRQHMRRGRFQTYTEEKPLFGKWAGTWWWAPHLAGDLDEGFVDKDYKIEN